MNKAQYMREIYLGGTQGVAPPFTTSTGKLLEEQAKEKLTPEAYGYVAGGASSETTIANNRKALDDWRIVPSMLGGVDVSSFDSSVTLFGKTYPTPLVICPIGVHSQLNKEEADIATARAASSLGVPFTLSSAGDRSIEEVQSAVEFDEEEEGNEAWYQLYWPSDDKLTESLLTRAKKAGYKALVVTLDTWALGWRPRDLDTAYNPFLRGQGIAQLASDPYFIETYCDGKDPRRSDITKEEILQVSATAVSLLNPGISRSWAELPLLRKIWGDERPILLKGIQSVADARRALDDTESRIDGIWVSNHGGRQVDGAIGALQALPAISNLCRQRGKTVIFDSGIRTGSDVIKALALGAHAVGIGRPYAYGLGIGGSEGVSNVLRGILADMELNAALCGCKSVKEIGRDMLVRSGEKL
ncbi:FMN-dependent alpha-hydroxy acid dehydrogenase [Microstroma glucosiphilum]|uniref:FMN-dependent alpha-hydroxy acid dehydrogenase n=1 Tax=Pseudomicrostroma glucosiphilum TaxID=1684307 RepID=A0A316UDS5_9BASI|nr:FMN-dependent alpha-hydroxy acid dehydrogenase [Pseudomicrostroma glucosiphilum]PWN23359.1 FMN-dependent alpha-hydroxy acid dehydrogenase [Pseudomicrostroma glucosiphilum]